MFFRVLKADRKNTGILEFVDRSIMLIRLVAFSGSMTVEEGALVFIKTFFAAMHPPCRFVDDRLPRFTNLF